MNFNLVLDLIIQHPMHFKSRTEMFQEALDTGKFAYGIFIDLQEDFDTVDHQII